ncbi:MAG: hypothetical protein ABFD25_08895 [Clostridiaceae bacterium]
MSRLIKTPGLSPDAPHWRYIEKTVESECWFGELVEEITHI